MGLFSRCGIAAAFLSAGLSDPLYSQDNPTTLDYASLKPGVVLHDSFADTDMVFIEAHVDENKTTHEKLARYDRTMGMACQWDKVSQGNNVTLSNPKCAKADSLPDEWATAPAGDFGKYIRLLGESPRYSRFSDDWIVEVFGAVNPVTHNVIMTKRIWDLEKSLVCLFVEEGYQEPGNKYSRLDFGCHPISNRDYVNKLVEEIALQP